jgi:hypothetical protein
VIPPVEVVRQAPLELDPELDPDPDPDPDPELVKPELEPNPELEPKPDELEPKPDDPDPELVKPELEPDPELVKPELDPDPELVKPELDPEEDEEVLPPSSNVGVVLVAHAACTPAPHATAAARTQYSLADFTNLAAMQHLLLA